MKKILIVMPALFLILPTLLFSQQKETTNRTFGLSAVYQGSQFDIMTPIWVGKKFVIAPALGVLYAETVGTNISTGVALKFYKKLDRVSPYFGTRLGALMGYPEEGDTTTDFFAGLLFGGEFFFTSCFSVAVESQVNVVKSDKNSANFGNPDHISVNTGTVLMANIYF